MQSMPYYQQQQGYQTQAPYQNPGAPASNVLNNGPSISGPMMNHPNGLPPMQHPGIIATTDQSQSVVVGGQQAPKRKQVKNACTNCQKACKKCDDARPCPRCIKYGIADTCVNSVRKERKKGIKRGPYKRRQKTGEEKPRKAITEMNNNNNNEQNGQPAQYAPSMRGPTIPFGYPSNLNQYGQPYDPYQYANYHKEQMMSQPYVVNPVYPPMGYPVLVPGTNENGQQQQAAQQQQQQQQQQHPYQQQQNNNIQQQQNNNIQQQQHSPMPQQHYNNIMHQQQQQSPQTSRPPMMQQHNEHVMHQQSPAGSPQVYYQQPQQHSQPPSQRSSPHLPDIKHEHNENFAKPQPMTPVPSTSTSTATTASPDSGSWVPPRSS
ncbi:hypothetical protein EDC94DRAFT_612647 [Helicostylum pulchrum]|nr:hypothetical protein EDC94DRAFT_612647 [Helicostylum pulchrum]